MNEHPIHHTHPEIVKRLRRAEGHLRSIIEMIETERPCLDVAQQLHAVERAIAQAKKTLIHDHVELPRTGCRSLGARAARPGRRIQGNHKISVSSRPEMTLYIMSGLSGRLIPCSAAIVVLVLCLH